MNRPPSELERTVAAFRAKGLAYCQANLEAEILKEGKENVLAGLINDLRKADPKMSEAQLKTEATGSIVYRDYVYGMVMARGKALRAKVEWESIEKLFSARQSDAAMLREQLSKGVYYAGG